MIIADHLHLIISVKFSKGRMMHFDQAIQAITLRLQTEDPPHFSPSWIRKHCPQAYCHIARHIATECDDIDWDRVTLALPKFYHHRWHHRHHENRRLRPPRSYRNQREVNRIIKPYRHKLYTFVTTIEKEDEAVRNMLTIQLVRLAQRGNLHAKEKLLGLIIDTVNDWIETYTFLGRWRCYPDRLTGTIEGCIRRYRYSGSFFSYLYRTLQYGALQLRPLEAFSIDEISAISGQRLADNVVQDPETGEIKMYER